MHVASIDTNPPLLTSKANKKNYSKIIYNTKSDSDLLYLGFFISIGEQKLACFKE